MRSSELVRLIGEREDDVGRVEEVGATETRLRRGQVEPLPNPVKFGAVSAGLGAIAISVLLIAAIEIGLADLDTPARRALMIFAVAIVGWTLTPLDDTFVALAAAVAMALFVVGSPDDLFRPLAIISFGCSSLPSSSRRHSARVGLPTCWCARWPFGRDRCAPCSTP
jgi:hypothetical protein